MQRELDEEVEIGSTYTSRRVGLINDDQTEVGRVHLGIVHIFDVASPAIAPREPDIAEPGFVPVEEILADLSSFETWSQICLQALFGRTWRSSRADGIRGAPNPARSPCSSRWGLHSKTWRAPFSPSSGPVQTERLRRIVIASSVAHLLFRERRITGEEYP